MNSIATENKPIIIIGAGGHSKVVIDTLEKLNCTIIGIVAPDVDVGTLYCGIKILGDDEILSSYSAKEIILVNAIGVVPKKPHRWNVADKFRKLGFPFRAPAESYLYHALQSQCE